MKCVMFQTAKVVKKKTKVAKGFKMTAEESSNSNQAAGEVETGAVHPKLREKLERMEIESPGCVVPFEVYGQLLAVYLYDNDL